MCICVSAWVCEWCVSVSVSVCFELQAQSEAVLARISTSTDKKALKDCDIVVEVGACLPVHLFCVCFGLSSLALALCCRACTK